MKILILDDESHARQLIRSFIDQIKEICFEIREASTLEEAMNQLKSFEPDVAFLDINLKEGTSFDLLNLIGLDRVRFKVIFITAYDVYAIKAFKFNAIDYILKPIDPTEFDHAFKKAINCELNTHLVQLTSLQQHLQGDREANDQLVLKDHQQIQLVNIDDIVHCTSENNYTAFHFTDDSHLVISKTLKEYEDLLKKKRFFRTHRSHLINFKHFKKYDKRDGGYIQMSNGTIIPLARNRKEIFLKVLDML